MYKVEWDLKKKVLNLLQMINDYDVKNIYDLLKHSIWLF